MASDGGDEDACVETPLVERRILMTGEPSESAPTSERVMIDVHAQIIREMEAEIATRTDPFGAGVVVCGS
jgi:hypothetical protein